ncbi:SMP-30/gluconolactonase/LRE family protein [Sphingobacteruim zhuxiongii]|uniref:SMP-30/gluconolactonase/LRE family protein n=1 Tax=Sphingobacterium zhuxiongii TaxID=2662364 RepID=UPI001366458A|nr:MULTISPECIES: SMP-30/gluconolactonase/LRE family protein [unclassified Sphingobacterium]
MKNKILTPELLIDSSCELGEGPIWEAENNRLIWLDIALGKVHIWNASNDEHTCYQFSLKITALAKNKLGQYIAASNQGFVALDFERCTFIPIVDPEYDKPNNRFNDGKLDAYGRFWAGSMDEVNGEKGAGKLYMLNEDGRVETKISEVTCSNGLGWNKDNDRFYFIDSLAYNVVEYDFDLASGKISNKKVLYTFPEEEGLPDGMCVDANGNLWVAVWGAGKVVQIDIHQKIVVQEIHVPAKQVTSCAFGGINMNDLFITTARIVLSESQLQKTPQAGAVFCVRNVV